MPYNPSSDFVGLWSAVSGGVQKAQMPGLDFVVQALGRAGLLRISTSATAPIANQLTTAWFRPSNPSFQSEGTLFLWDTSLNMYVPATPELFLAMLGGNPGSGSGGGGSTGIEEAPNDGVQYARQSLAWTPVAGSAVIPPDGGGGSTDMAIVSPTPPPSPTSGTQWWDGTTMWVWNGTAWQAVSAGTTFLALSMSQETNLTLPGAPNTWQIVPYNSSPLVDTGPGWDPVTKKFTPKKAGYYAFQCRAYLAAVAGSSGLAILKNDDGVFDGGPSDIIIASQNNTSLGVVTSCIGFAQMNGTTDYVRVFAWSPNSTVNTAGSNPIFSALHLS